MSGVGDPSRDVEAIAVATVPCPRCEVRPGQPCVALSETGAPVQRADHPHEPRLLSVRAAYSLGWYDADSGQSARVQPMDVDLLAKIVIEGGRA